MKSPWYYTDMLFGKEKYEMKEIINNIQDEAWNAALEAVKAKGSLIVDDYSDGIDEDELEKLKK